MLGRRPPTKARTAKEKREIALEADRIYREKLRSEGVPSTREFADVLAYELLKSSLSDTAETIVKSALDTMLTITDASGKVRWTKSGIRKRYQYLHAQMLMDREAEVAAAKKAAA
jgi:hypothetical protein